MAETPRLFLITPKLSDATEIRRAARARSTNIATARSAPETVLVPGLSQRGTA